MKRFKVYGPYGSYGIKADNFEVDQHPGFQSLRFFLNDEQIAHFPAEYEVVDETALYGEQTDDYTRLPLYRDYMDKVCSDQQEPDDETELVPGQVWWHPDHGVVRILRQRLDTYPSAVLEWSFRDFIYEGPPGTGDFIPQMRHPEPLGGFLIRDEYGRLV